MYKQKLKTLKILLVEDETRLATLLKSAIGDNFYSFHISSNGEEGLEMFKTLSPDIVITDIMMPNMDGLEMSQKIRAIHADVPIIILSAFSETDNLLNAIDIGVVKYFIKPFDPEELLEYIYEISEKIESKLVALVDNFSFNINKSSLYKNSRYISLSKNENKFVQFLLQNYTENEMLQDEDIKILLWGDKEANDARLRTFIRRFRQKTSKNLVLNFKGLGYQINKQIER